MIKQMNEFKNRNPCTYKKLVDEVAECAYLSTLACRERAWHTFLLELRKSEKALSELGKTSGVNIETPDLKLLSGIANKYGAAGKLSGAGGGDCGIAVCFDDDTAIKVVEGWKEAGICPIDTSIDSEGVRKE